MGWSNQLPPQIQTLQDGTTQFTGPIVVDKSDGSTAASIGTDGSVNGQVGNFKNINLNGNDLATTIAQYSKGTLATATLDSSNSALSSSNTYTVNNTTPCLILLTGGFKTDGSRAYEVKVGSFKAYLDTAGDLWRYEIVAYVDTYPTSSNYQANAVHIAGGLVQAVGSAGNYEFPFLYDFRAFQAHNQVWVGLLITRVSGTGGFRINVANAPVFMTVTDAGPSGNYSTGVYDPVSYTPSGGAPAPTPPPPTQNYNQNFGATWSQSYDSNGSPFSGGTPHMYQGDPDSAGGFGHGIQLSAANWDYSTIGSYLNGASNISGTLYFYCEHAWYSGGVQYLIFTHNTRTGSSPSSSSGILNITNNQFGGTAPNPGWISIPLSSGILSGFANGLLSGFGFYANSTDLSYYGYFGGASESNIGAAPYINISWTK